MLFGAVGLSFVVLAALSMPIVFALGLSGFVGLLIGNFSLEKLPSSLVAGTQHWVLLAIPTFVFAGNLMERCGMSYALVNLARVLVGWVRGGLGMSVVLAEYFFSGISGSTIADVSAIGSMLTPPMLRAGYKPEHAVSLVASASAMGILVPPAIFMIVLGQITDTSVVGIFLGGFIPAAVSALCLMAVILLQAHRLHWPKDEPPTWPRFIEAGRASLVPLVVPVIIVLGFFFGVFTATEAGALVAAYAMAAAFFYYKNVTWREMLKLIYESALLTAAVIFLLAVASVYQFLMGMLGVPRMLGELLGPLAATPWLFLVAVSLIVILLRHGAGRAPRRRGARARGVSHRQGGGHSPGALQYRPDRGGRDRALPAADRRRPPHGAALRQYLGRPALQSLLALSARAARGTAPAHRLPRDHAVPATLGGVIR